MTETGDMSRRGLLRSILYASVLTVGKADSMSQEQGPATASEIIQNGVVLVGRGRFSTVVDVVAIADQKIYGVNEYGPLEFPLTPGVRLWKGRFYSGVDLLKPGDDLWIWGRLRKDGSLAVYDLMANIHKIVGAIRLVSGNQLQVVPFSYQDGSLLNPVGVTLYDTVNFLGGVYSDLTPGSHVEVTGLLGDDQTLYATAMHILGTAAI